MKKAIIVGGLSICLFFGVILYNYKVIEPEGGLTKDILCESKNQNGYPMSNFGVSISNGKIVSGTDGIELLEFVIENESAKKWYWRRNINFNEKNGEDEATDLEVEIEGIWYNIPLKKDRTDLIIPLVKLHLLPGSTSTISVWTGIYQAISPGNYRFTIIVYDDDFNEFNLSCEFVTTEEEK